MKNTQIFAKHTLHQSWLLPELISTAGQVRKLVPLHVMKEGKTGLFSPKNSFFQSQTMTLGQLFFRIPNADVEPSNATHSGVLRAPNLKIHVAAFSHKSNRDLTKSVYWGKL